MSTPLHGACAGGYAEIAISLLEAKAEVRLKWEEWLWDGCARLRG
jgi:ankyrin repeat protein